LTTTAIIQPVKHAVGDWNVSDVSPTKILGRFNPWMQCVLLVVSEARDLGEVDRFSFYEHCKTYLATPPEWINCDEKHIKEQKVANVMGVVFTTNHRTSGIHLPPDDRRHFVAWSNLTREAFPPDYFTRLYRWYAQGGLDHVAAYLRGLDIRHFDPKAEPEKTEAWHAIVSADVSPGESELADALDALGVPVAITMDQIRRAAETQQLIELCTTLNDGRSARRVPHMMESVGYTQVRNQAAKDGKWKVGGKKRHIYGLRTKTYSEHYQAIMCFPLLTETRIR
jgi:hypothetical protein